MPAKDSLHDVVRRALEKAGWRIVSESQTITFNDRTLYLDIIAEKNGKRIAVEVEGTSFSSMTQLERAVGQFVIYRHVLNRDFADIELFIAAPAGEIRRVFDLAQKDGENSRASLDLNLIAFDIQKEEITQWTP